MTESLWIARAKTNERRRSKSLRQHDPAFSLFRLLARLSNANGLIRSPIECIGAAAESASLPSPRGHRCRRTGPRAWQQQRTSMRVRREQMDGSDSDQSAGRSDKPILCTARAAVPHQPLRWQGKRGSTHEKRENAIRRTAKQHVRPSVRYHGSHHTIVAPLHT